MSADDTLGQLFELAIALEKTADMFYRGLARRFKHVPEVTAFWTHYADEEAGHARWLDGLRSQLEPAKLRLPIDPVMIDSATRQLQISPEKMLARITNLEEAYQAAVEAENAETNTIFEFLVTDYSLSHRSRNFLRNQIHVHADRITSEFPASFRDHASRLAVKVKES